MGREARVKKVRSKGDHTYYGDAQEFAKHIQLIERAEKSGLVLPGDIRFGKGDVQIIHLTD